MEFYLGTFLFSAGLIQAILLISVLMRKSSAWQPNTILAVFILVISLQVGVRLLGLYSHPENWKPVYLISFYLPYLYGPLLYFYINKIKNGRRMLSASNFLHFIPFILSVCLVIVQVYGIVNVFNYINNDIYNIADTFFQAALLSIYVAAGKKTISRVKNHYCSNTGQAGVEKWLNNFSNIVWVTGVMIIIIFTFIYYNVEFYRMNYDTFGLFFLFLPALIYWISYNTLLRPELFSGYNHAHDVKTFIKYGNNQLSPAEITAIINSINNYCEREKAHLNPRFSLDMLSESVNISKHHISQAVNSGTSMNFNDFINQKRIDYAKKELLNPAKKHLTIAAIAFEAGFNSISSFNEVFKKHTSVTPSSYKKTYMNKQNI